MKKKACYNCGDFSHLGNDCRKMVQKETTRSQNHAYVSPSHRSAGQRSYSAPMRPSHRPAGHRPHGPPMRPMISNMNGARQKRTSAVRPQYRALWVPTINRNFPPVNRKLPTGNSNIFTVCCCCSRHVNTARPKAVINRRNRVKDVQASTCWTISHWQYKFPLLVKVVATARRLEMPLPEVCTAIEEKKKKLPELETLKEEKDVVDGKLACLLKSSKDLESLIESQRPEKIKDGLGYNAVPPPAADLYLSPKKDLSWMGLPEFADNTVTDYSRPAPLVKSTSEDG
nr:hypothetical protein [Tanacetum cinerariifolium]